MPRKPKPPAAGPDSPVSAPAALPLPDAAPAPAAAPAAPARGLRIAFVADVHVGVPRWCGGPVEVGLNRRGRMVVKLLRAAVERAHALGCAAFVVCGDLFDTSSPAPQVVAAVGRALTAAPFPCGVHLLTGNHDIVSDAPGDHALAPLSLVPGITVHEVPTWVPVAGPGHHEVAQMLLLPFRSGDSRVRLRDDVQATPALPDVPGPRVVALHAGISDAATPLHLKGAPDALPLQQVVALARAAGASAVFAGNWHDRRTWEVPGDDNGQPVAVVQCGALVPTDFRNPGLEGYGTLGLWSPLFGATYEVLPGPRFVLVHDRAGFDRAVHAARSTHSDCALFVRWVAHPHDFADAVGLMREETTLGVFAGGDVVPVADAARADVRAAVANVQKPGNLRIAVQQYVDALPDCDEAQRGRVTDIVFTYLNLKGAP